MASGQSVSEFFGGGLDCWVVSHTGGTLVVGSLHVADRFFSTRNCDDDHNMSKYGGNLWESVLLPVADLQHLTVT